MYSYMHVHMYVCIFVTHFLYYMYYFVYMFCYFYLITRFYRTFFKQSRMQTRTPPMLNKYDSGKQCMPYWNKTWKYLPFFQHSYSNQSNMFSTFPKNLNIYNTNIHTYMSLSMFLMYLNVLAFRVMTVSIKTFSQSPITK